MNTAVLKAAQLTVHEQNHVNCKRYHTSVNVIAFSDLDFILMASIIGNFVAFQVILATISLCMHRNGYL